MGYCFCISTIDKVDTTPPTISAIDGNPTDWTPDDVTLTVTATDAASGLQAEAYSFDDGATWQVANHKTFNSNETVTIKARDAVGNISNPQVVAISKIDKIKPEISSIDGIPTDWTPEDVTLTVTAADAASGLHTEAYSFDNGATWQADNRKTFSNNQTVTIKVRDAVGNISDPQVIEISKIDKTKPESESIDGNPTDWTPDDVTLTVTAADAASGLHAEAYSFDDGATWQADNHKTFSSNQTVTIKVRDAVGNISDLQVVEINKIDKNPPVVDQIEGNPTDWTTDNVTLSVIAADTQSDLHAEAYSFDDGVTWQADNHKTYDSNQAVIIRVRDVVGNVSAGHMVIISKIDTAPPTISTIKGNPTDWTADNVTLTVIATDEASGLHNEAYSFDDGQTWQVDSHKTFIINQTVNIRVRDALGNISNPQTIEINRIDKAAPAPPKDDPSSLPAVPGDDTIVPPDDKDLEWVHTPKPIEATAAAPSGIKKYQYQIEQVNQEIQVEPVLTRVAMFSSKQLLTLAEAPIADSWVDSLSGEVLVYDEGIFRVKLRAISNAGNISPVSTYTVKNDFTAPEISHDLHGYHLTLNAQDALSGVTKMTICYEDEINEYQAEQITLANAKSGDYSITAVDLAGNEQVYTVTVPVYDDGDDDPPMMVIVDKPTVTKPVPPQVVTPKTPPASSEPSIGSDKDNTDDSSDTDKPSEVETPVGQKSYPSILRYVLSLWWFWLILLLAAYIIYKRTKNKRAD